MKAIVSTLFFAAGVALAQSQGPVTTVGTGRAAPNYANPFANNPVRTGVVNQTSNTPGKVPSFHEFITSKTGQPQRADSPEAAEAWVAQVSPTSNEASIDPVTGQPKFTATVTQTRIYRARGGDGQSHEIFASWLSALNALMNYGLDLPKKPGPPPAISTTRK